MISNRSLRMKEKEWRTLFVLSKRAELRKMPGKYRN